MCTSLDASVYDDQTSVYALQFLGMNVTIAFLSNKQMYTLYI